VVVLPAALLAAQVAYHFISSGDHTTITGCALPFVAVAPYTYQGWYGNKYTAWEENSAAQTPGLNRRFAEYIWCK